MSIAANGGAKLQDEADAAAAAGDFARALRLLEQAVERQEASSELWMKLTAMRRAAGDTAGALESVERALA
ncbi:MAG TPA: tetratricopeptide repeat protein, partial [Sphingomicrobium sp.]|nr:tetratricopeptide repeat protein [Sphingomicrobium sp.]